MTPSLNQGAFIEETIQSVLEQDYPSIEHVVVDGGSTDETLEIVRRYPHLRWVSEPDRGQADAINRGFAIASGEIFGWLNSDDLYLPGAVSAAAAVLQQTGCGMVHGGWRQIDEHGAIINDIAPVPFDLRRQLDHSNRVAQPGALFTRAAFEAVGGLDPSYRYALDYEFFLRIGLRFEVRHIDRVLAAYRYHPRSKTVSESDGFVDETIRAARAHGARFRSPMVIDYYLPRRRPFLFRIVLAYRLARDRDLSGLAARVVPWLRWPFTSRRGSA